MMTARQRVIVWSAAVLLTLCFLSMAVHPVRDWIGWDRIFDVIDSQ